MNFSLTFKDNYVTSIEKQVHTTYSNLSRFCLLVTAPVVGPNFESSSQLEIETPSKYTEPKKKLSQNRTSLWAYSLRKKKNGHLPQMKLKYQTKLMIFRLYMNFDELIFNHCAITNTNKNC